jgi:hypothetical protein
LVPKNQNSTWLADHGPRGRAGRRRIRRFADPANAELVIEGVCIPAMSSRRPRESRLWTRAVTTAGAQVKALHLAIADPHCRLMAKYPSCEIGAYYATCDPPAFLMT